MPVQTRRIINIRLQTCRSFWKRCSIATKKRFGVDITTDEVMSVYGSQEAMAHIGLTLCDPGDLILVPNPGYPMFEMSGIMAHAEIGYYTIEEKNGYLPDLESIPEDMLRRARYMIVSYPLNPVCVCAPDEFYERLIAFAKGK